MYAFAIWDKKNSTCPTGEARFVVSLATHRWGNVTFNWEDLLIFLGGDLNGSEKIMIYGNAAHLNHLLFHISRSEKRSRQRIWLPFFTRMTGCLFLIPCLVCFKVRPDFVISKRVVSEEHRLHLVFPRVLPFFAMGASTMGGTWWHVIQLESFLCTLDGGGTHAQTCWRLFGGVSPLGKWFAVRPIPWCMNMTRIYIYNYIYMNIYIYINIYLYIYIWIYIYMYKCCFILYRYYMKLYCLTCYCNILYVFFCIILKCIIL